MEDITIDYHQFAELVEKVDRIYTLIQTREELPNKSEDEDEPWLDSSEVCNMLHISDKTLWRLRRDKLIPYSKMRGRCRYLPSEIYKAIKAKVITCNPKFAQQFHQNYIRDAK